MTLAGKWQSTGGREGEIFLEIDRIDSTGSFTGRLHLLQDIHCVARGEAIANGRISDKLITFSAPSGPSKLCRGLVFKLNTGGPRLLEGATETGMSVWLERTTANPPNAPPIAAFATRREVREAGGAALTEGEIRQLVTDTPFWYQEGEWWRKNESRANGDVWVNLLSRPIGGRGTFVKVGDWFVNDKGAYCVVVAFPDGIDRRCRGVWGFEGKYYFVGAGGRLLPLTFKN